MGRFFRNSVFALVAFVLALSTLGASGVQTVFAASGCPSNYAANAGYSNGEFPAGYVHSTGTLVCSGGGWVSYSGSYGPGQIDPAYAGGSQPAQPVPVQSPAQVQQVQQVQPECNWFMKLFGLCQGQTPRIPMTEDQAKSIAFATAIPAAMEYLGPYVIKWANQPPGPQDMLFVGAVALADGPEPGPADAVATIMEGGKIVYQVGRVAFAAVGTWVTVESLRQMLKNNTLQSALTTTAATTAAWETSMSTVYSAEGFTWYKGHSLDEHHPGSPKGQERLKDLYWNVNQYLGDPRNVGKIGPIVYCAVVVYKDLSQFIRVFYSPDGNMGTMAWYQDGQWLGVFPNKDAAGFQNGWPRGAVQYVPYTAWDCLKVLKGNMPSTDSHPVYTAPAP